MHFLNHHLKHWFLPHRQNDHRPHLIRIRGLAILALVIIGVQVTANVTRAADVRVLSYAVDITPVDLLNQTNQQRVANGLSALRMDSRLNSSAQMKAQDMLSNNYWAHVSPNGVQPWYWFQQAGYGYSYAGENLAMGFDTTSGTMTGWMNSPGHRANILNSNYTDVGFSVVNGTLLGVQTTLVVAHYGHINGAPPAATVPSSVQSNPTPVAAKAAPVAAASTPIPTPVITPAPTIAPTSTPVPLVTNQKLAKTSGDIREAAPLPQSYSIFRPLSITRTLNWSNLITFVLLTALLLVYVLTHMTVWRKGLKRWKHRKYKNIAIVQIGSLVILLTIIAVSGYGRVG